MSRAEPLYTFLLIWKIRFELPGGSSNGAKYEY